MISTALVRYGTYIWDEPSLLDVLEHNSKYSSVLSELLKVDQVVEGYSSLVFRKAHVGDYTVTTDEISAFIRETPDKVKILEELTRYKAKTDGLNLEAFQTPSHKAFLETSFVQMTKMLKDGGESWKSMKCVGSDLSIQANLDNGYLFDQLTESFAGSIVKMPYETISSVLDIGNYGGEIGAAFLFVPKIFMVVGALNLVPHLLDIFNPGWIKGFINNVFVKIELLCLRQKVAAQNIFTRILNYAYRHKIVFGVGASFALTGGFNVISWFNHKPTLLAIKPLEVDLFREVSAEDQRKLKELKSFGVKIGLALSMPLTGFYKGLRVPILDEIIHTLNQVGTWYKKK